MVCNRHNIHQGTLLQATRPLESLAGFLATFPSVFALWKRVPWGAGARCFLLPWRFHYTWTGKVLLASHADVLRGSSRVQFPLHVRGYPAPGFDKLCHYNFGIIRHYEHTFPLISKKCTASIIIFALLVGSAAHAQTQKHGIFSTTSRSAHALDTRAPFQHQIVFTKKCSDRSRAAWQLQSAILEYFGSKARFIHNRIKEHLNTMKTPL